MQNAFSSQLCNSLSSLHFHETFSMKSSRLYNISTKEHHATRHCIWPMYFLRNCPPSRSNDRLKIVRASILFFQKKPASYVNTYTSTDNEPYKLLSSTVQQKIDPHNKKSLSSASHLIIKFQKKEDIELRKLRQAGQELVCLESSLKTLITQSLIRAVLSDELRLWATKERAASSSFAPLIAGPY